MTAQKGTHLPPYPRYKAAAIQYAPTLFEKEQNLLEQLELVEEAARVLAIRGADLICVPGALEYPRAAALGATEVPHPSPIMTGPAVVHIARVRRHHVGVEAKRTIRRSPSPTSVATGTSAAATYLT